MACLEKKRNECQVQRVDEERVRVHTRLMLAKEIGVEENTPILEEMDKKV